MVLNKTPSPLHYTGFTLFDGLLLLFFRVVQSAAELELTKIPFFCSFSRAIGEKEEKNPLWAVRVPGHTSYELNLQGYSGRRGESTGFMTFKGRNEWDNPYNKNPGSVPAYTGRDKSSRRLDALRGWERASTQPIIWSSELRISREKVGHPAIPRAVTQYSGGI
ncbi:hypothetical protein EVAR_80785_1 [Eumeta japonica]|uniref:Uncharacterized protein n=1 Tax=Eumeta variegata TaxID=151549 RepID=A0A4C1WG67_EUMVA|nr:hypothetical protein EVAR_80785_1 [Eumeta japonica]